MIHKERVKKFIIVGISAAIVNFILIILFVEILGLKSYFLKNLANFLAIEISIGFNFALSRGWTWRDAPQKQGRGLFAQFLSFNLAALTGITLRVFLFAILEKEGIFYLLNVVLGIGLAATVDFLLYDKLVFRRLAK